MDHDLKHLKFLLKMASSLNLWDNNPVGFKVVVNDYRYYKSKFIQKYKKEPNIIENGEKAQIHWKYIKHPYDGKVKYGIPKGRNQSNWYNFDWVTNKNK